MEKIIGHLLALPRWVHWVEQGSSDWVKIKDGKWVKWEDVEKIIKQYETDNNKS